MLTLFYSPMTRSSRIMTLVDELGIADQIDLRRVDIVRFDGSGRRDPANAHPEGKVPYLIHDGAEIWESTAIALYLTELFPDAGLGRAVGHPERGPLLSWLAWYGDVVEPLIVVAKSGLEVDKVRSAWRGMSEMHARLDAALADGRDYLLKGGYSVADLIVASAFGWDPSSAPTSERAKAWVARCQSRPAGQQVWAREMEMVKAHAA
ncbi:MAG: glutathione S-transferase family protein [Deltaproteobacteria bacterium]